MVDVLARRDCATTSRHVDHLCGATGVLKVGPFFFHVEVLCAFTFHEKIVKRSRKDTTKKTNTTLRTPIVHEPNPH